MASNDPRLKNPWYLAIIKEPNPAIVVRDVSNTARPVLRITILVLSLPSMRYLCSICTPSSIPIPIIMGIPIRFIKVKGSPIRLIIPTIQIVPETRGIIAIRALLKLLKSIHNNKKTVKTVSITALLPSRANNSVSLKNRWGVPVIFSLIRFI